MIGIARRRIPLLNDDGRGIIDNYGYVDLGLPSGLLWATCNVGASVETDYGNYYQWGAGSTQYANRNQYHTGGTDSTYTLPLTADTARQVMGGGWRMPKRAELLELINNTTYTFTTINGVSGGKFSKTVDGKERYVFFPAAGLYDKGSLLSSSYGHFWSSNPGYGSEGSNSAYFLAFSSEGKLINYNKRSYGRSVRAVISA